jgi:hypothetical protein
VCRVRKPGFIGRLGDRPAPRELTGAALQAHSTDGRRGTPTDIVNGWRKRDGDSPTLAAIASSDTASAWDQLRIFAA